MRINHSNASLKYPSILSITLRILQNYIQSVIVDNNTIKATFKVAFNFWIDDGEFEICYNHTVIEARKNLQKSA